LWTVLKPDDLAGLGATSGASITVHRSTEETGLSAALEKTAELVHEATDGAVRLEHGEGADVVAVPAMALRDTRQRAIDYLALPEDAEVAPFVEALTMLARGEQPDDPWCAQLRELATPARLLVFLASDCPHCPHAVRVALHAALATPRVHAVVVDAQRYPHLAAAYKVSSVPLTVVDEDLALSGVLAGTDLARHLQARGGEEHEVAIFGSLIETGRLDEAAGRLRSTPAGGRAFQSAWQKSSTSTRMALLLIAERVLAGNRRCLDPIVLALCETTLSDDAALRGDTADLLGQIGDRRARVALERLLDDDNPDVAEIAADAIAALSEHDS
jgi:hypothetical protein